MIDWLTTVLLALIQGLSEFLPISSSAHLVLPSQLLGWADQGLMFDVAVHVGTLLAVVIYFRRDLLALMGDFHPGLTRNAPRGELWSLVIATLPVIAVGSVAGPFVEHSLRTLWVIALTTLIFGLFLGWAAWVGARSNGDAAKVTMTPRDGLVIGLAQVCALVPGVSRSGVTITAGLFLGYSPQAAARFSFLLSVPVILGAMAFLAIDILSGFSGQVPVRQMLVAAGVAGISAYLTIAFFLRLLDRIGLMPFVGYRLVLGVVLLGVIFFTGDLNV